MAEAKKILVLGAGRVSRPCVQYILKQGHKVTVVDQYEENAKKAIGGHPGGTAVVGNGVTDAAKFIRAYQPDVVVCILPTAFMVQTAKTCIDEGVSMIGGSYVKDEMRALDAEAKAKGLRILCEVGLDPGIDHMSAVEKIKEVHAKGGQIESFVSVCGALTDLASNTNPIGYKLSWAPASLIGASKRSARIIVDGKLVDMPDGVTYQHPWFMEIYGLGWLEAYCNADSTPYLEAYGIPEAKTIKRGTLRYPGWSDMITQMQKLRLFEEEPRDFAGYTYASLMKELAGCKNASESAKACVAKFIGLEEFAVSMLKLEWLGFFDETPVSPQKGSVRDVVAELFDKHLVFSPGEKDMIAMQHEYIVYDPASGKRQRITSTLVDRGDVDGDTAIAHTTGMPIGIAAHLVASGAVKGYGVLLPTTEDIYIPALAELAKEGLHFEERETDI